MLACGKNKKDILNILSIFIQTHTRISFNNNNNSTLKWSYLKNLDLAQNVSSDSPSHNIEVFK